MSWRYTGRCYDTNIHHSKGWLMTPSLATVPGKLLTMLFVTHHSDTLAPKQRHLLEPAHLV
jgi:hypothetical protein